MVDKGATGEQAMQFIVSISELRVLLLVEPKCMRARIGMSHVSISELRVLLLVEAGVIAFAYTFDDVSISELRVLLLVELCESYFLIRESYWFQSQN